MSFDKFSKESETHAKPLRCSVKNCGCAIRPGEEIKFGGHIYCKTCGSQIISQTFSLF